MRTPLLKQKIYYQRHLYWPIMTLYSLPLCLTRDASAYGIGVVISHTFPNRDKRSIVYALHTLSSSEKNYAQLEREALALI